MITLTSTTQALDTYKTTVRDDDRSTWPNWIMAVSNSLACGEWIDAETLPPFAKEVFEIVKAENLISMSDSK